MNAIQRSVVIRAAKIGIHRAACGQVLGKIAPLAARAANVHDTVVATVTRV
jgi:hypothetical protein